ncbi:MAG: 4Fe-4S binding protein [Nitrospirae bacterium]|nr:4Fe-4S binding protein [Nitrospirota bacterium]
MQANTTTNKSFLQRNRYWIMLASAILLLPPLSFLFQFTADNNFCGSWCPRMFFVWRKGMSGSEYLMGFIRSYMGVSLVFGILASTFFFGRYWCSHLCPIGGTMEGGSRVLPKFLKINYSVVPAASFRYGYLAVYFIASAIGIGSLCCNYCNFATIPRIVGAAFSQADVSYFLRSAGLVNLGLVAGLGFIAQGGRAYCNLLCPLGALDALSNRLGLRIGKRMLIDSTKCNGCTACARVCPTWSIEVKEKKAGIDQLSCMPCGECRKVCAQEAISYGKSAH